MTEFDLLPSMRQRAKCVTTKGTPTLPIIRESADTQDNSEADYEGRASQIAQGESQLARPCVIFDTRIGAAITSFGTDPYQVGIYKSEVSGHKQSPS